MTEPAAKDGLELALRGHRSDWRNSKAEADAEQWARLLAPLALAMPGIDPPTTLAAKIGHAVDQAETDLARTVEERLEEGRWREIAPRIEIKQLWDDKTFLIRCAPGGVWPGTPDRRFDHIVILQGDMLVGDQILGAGDYHRAPAAMAQDAFTSRTGLLLLVRYQ